MPPPPLQDSRVGLTAEQPARFTFGCELDGFKPTQMAVQFTKNIGASLGKLVTSLRYFSGCGGALDFSVSIVNESIGQPPFCSSCCYLIVQTSPTTSGNMPVDNRRA